MNKPTPKPRTKKKSVNDMGRALLRDALDVCSALVYAYQYGGESGGSIEWNDLDEAYKRALKTMHKLERYKKLLLKVRA